MANFVLYSLQTNIMNRVIKDKQRNKQGLHISENTLALRLRTYDGNQVHRYNNIIQAAVALFRYKDISASLAITHSRIRIMPSNSCFAGFLAETIWSNFL